jgi:hypothetical protein
MPESFVQFCPVPTEQQPLNEYEQLKESWFFSLPTLDRGGYSRKLFWICCWGWLFVSPLAWASFPPSKYLGRFLLSGSLAVGVILSLLILRLYLGWRYICDRLQSEKIFYEESGWYDGQIWTKTKEILTRDRLIVSYQIEPILSRLKQTAIFLTLIISLISLFWFLR